MKTPLLLLAALAVVLAGYSALRGSAPRGLEWERVVPAGDCHCADGSQFAFWERRADPTKVSQKYSPELTVEHRGYVNGTAALSYLAEHYPNATQVVVVGKTAGSVAAPLYGGFVADRLPKAKVTVFGAQSGAWPNNPDFNADILDARWGAYDTMPDWAVKGLTVQDWGVPRFWTQAGLHNPNLVLARFDFAFDPHAASEVTQWMDGNPPNLLAVIDGNEAAIEATGVRLHSYTAPGADHQIFEPDKFYDIEVNGVRLVDWLDTLITNEPPDDVHCDQCDP